MLRWESRKHHASPVGGIVPCGQFRGNLVGDFILSRCASSNHASLQLEHSDTSLTPMGFRERAIVRVENKSEVSDRISPRLWRSLLWKSTRWGHFWFDSQDLHDCTSITRTSCENSNSHMTMVDEHIMFEERRALHGMWGTKRHECPTPENLRF